jgi:hypothetical protein
MSILAYRTIHVYQRYENENNYYNRRGGTRLAAFPRAKRKIKR